MIIAFAHLLFIVVVYKFDFQQIKMLSLLYIGMGSLFIFFYGLFFAHSEKIIVTFFWYALVPIGSITFYSIKSGVYSVFLCMVLVAATIIFSPYLPNKLDLDAQHLKFINTVTIFYVLGLMAFLYYLFEKIHVKSNENLAKIHFTNNRQTQNIEKNNELYRKICIYFDEKKAYTNSKISLAKIAIDLNSNPSYILMALKQNNEKNFNTFVNRYRVAMVKKMFANGNLKKFTMKSIYSSAGFGSQSTFNFIFKQFEGCSPSEYIQLLQDKME